MTTLTKHERADLAECEAIIERALNSFDEFGKALADIRDRKLYRANYDTWDAYCQGRWNMRGSRARQLIAAALVKEDASGVAPLEIASEAQARPLAGLSSDERQDAWSFAVATSDGAPTGDQVRGAVAELADLRAAVQAAKGIFYSSRDGLHVVDLPSKPNRRYTSEELRAALGIQTVEAEAAPAELPATIYEVVEQMARQLEGSQELASTEDSEVAELIERAAARGYVVARHGNGFRCTKNGSPWGGAKTVEQLRSDVERFESYPQAVISPEEQDLIARAAACGYLVAVDGIDAQNRPTRYIFKSLATNEWLGNFPGGRWGSDYLRGKVIVWENPLTDGELQSIAAVNQSPDVERLMARATACGYEVRGNGKKFEYRKNGDSWSSALSKPQIEQYVTIWENAKLRKAAEEAEALELIERAAACGYTVVRKGMDAHQQLAYYEYSRIGSDHNDHSYVYGVYDLRGRVKAWEDKGKSVTDVTLSGHHQPVEPEQHPNSDDSQQIEAVLRPALNAMPGRALRVLALLFDRLFWDSDPTFLDTVCEDSTERVIDGLMTGFNTMLEQKGQAMLPWEEENLQVLRSLVQEELA